MTANPDDPAAGDAFTLSRFVDAQRATYPEALAELRAGHKRTHWMWFVFPQLAGLGSSPTARHYGIRSLAEAQAYLAHPLLGERLRECAQTLLALRGPSAEAIFGYPDVLKLRSSMTLFAEVPGADPVFDSVLARYYAGERDLRTLHLLAPDAG